MAWTRYKTINLLDFQESGLISKSQTFYLEGIGMETIEFFIGFNSCVLVRDEFLPINFNGENPYRSNGYGVYLDSDYNIHVEFEVPDEE